MPTQLMRPEFQIPNLESLVTTPEGNSFFTQTSHGLQYDVHLTMLEMLRRSNVRDSDGEEVSLIDSIPKGPILDAGCGDGLFFGLARKLNPKEFPGFPSKIIYGIDANAKKVTAAREVVDYLGKEEQRRSPLKKRYTPRPIYVSNPQKLQTMETEFLPGKTKINLPDFSMIWCLQMFHWLKSDKDKFDALRRFNRVLKDGGVLFLNMASVGTAADFLDAYHEVVTSLRPFHSTHNPKGYLRSEYEMNPIGSQPLHNIATILSQVGFDEVVSATFREEILHPNPTQYADSVRIYGWDAFLKPFDHYSASEKENFWKTVTAHFLEILGTKGWKEGTDWRYLSENNYLIARKTSSGTPEQSHDRKAPAHLISSYLNHKILQMGLKKLYIRGTLISFELTGNEHDLAKAESHVNPFNVISGIAHYAKDHWDAGSDPICHIHYARTNGTLNLFVDVGMKSAASPEETLDSRLLKQLRTHGGDIAVAPNENRAGHTRYHVKIPIISASSPA